MRQFKLLKQLQGKNMPGSNPAIAQQYPGQKLGMSLEQVRQFIAISKKCKGETFDIAAGANDFTIELSGTAKMLLGFSLLIDDTADANKPLDMQFIINEEIMIDQVNPEFFSPDFMDEEFYVFPRPLSGTDILKILVTGQANNRMFGAFYYL